ncbi:MAG: hypothetical protein ACRC10_11415 [Thermoguttaceae bacterium]
MLRFLLFALSAVVLFVPAKPLSAQETFSLVFDFEKGNLQDEDWTIVEGTNSKPIGNRTVEFHNEQVPYQKSGSFYLTTLEESGNAGPTDDVQCVIESPVFQIQGKEIKLLVGGGQRPNTYVALCILQEDGSAKEVLRASGQNHQGLEEVVWRVGRYVGKPAFFKVVDLETGSWAHIRADHFRLNGVIDPVKTEFRRTQLAENRGKNQRLKRLEELGPIQEAIADLFGGAENQLIREKWESRLQELQEQVGSDIDFGKKLNQLKREILSSNPLLRDYPILYVSRQQYVPDHHNTETMFQTGEINTNSFKGGGALKVWDPKTDKTWTLLEVPDGIVRDPCIHFDAKKVLFSLRKDIQDDYHIYEMDIDLARPTLVIRGGEGANGLTENVPGLRQLTFTPGITDIDPLYLPSGEILFSSTREPKFCMCNRHIMCNLFTMNGDGSNLQQIGHSTLFEGHPSLLPDGRVLYDRWEYVDRNFGDAQGVWVTNPDGTNHALFWGNNTASPGAVLDNQILPGTDSVFLGTFSSCHDRPWGAIALVDRRRGLDGKGPVLQTWPKEAIDLVDVGGYDTFIGIRQKFEDPFPLSEKYYLASGMVNRGEEMGIWLLDRFGNMTLIHEEEPGCYDPMPLRPTSPPPVIASRIDLNDPNGYFYVSNVYEGFGMQNVEPGSVKSLRIVESPEKRFWTNPAWDGGTGQQAPGMSWDDFNNKRILGTVDVEEDGSVFFTIPADTYVYFQLLDENGMMIQSMRSGTMVRPGETNGCYGCHENRLETPPKQSTTPLAMQKPPQVPKSWYGPTRLFSYFEEVQPVFDKYCVSCHDFGEPGAEFVVLAGDRNLVFNTSFVELRSKGYVHVTGAGPSNKLEPYSWGSHKSPLASVLLNGHFNPITEAKCQEQKQGLNKEKDREAFDRVMTWIDINAPYYPTYGSAYRDNRFGRSPLNEAQLKRLQRLFGSDPTWSVSLDRPEKSPGLSKLSKDSRSYKEALSLIEEGARLLREKPRGENADFVPVDPVEMAQQQKYDTLQEVERKMRAAIIEGDKLLEKAVQDLR